MDKKSSVKLYYLTESANGTERLTSKTINFVKNDASAEDIEAIKTGFGAMMAEDIKRVDRVTVETL